MSYSFSRLKRTGIICHPCPYFWFLSLAGAHYYLWIFFLVSVFIFLNDHFVSFWYFLWIFCGGGVPVPWHAHRYQNLQELVLSFHPLSSRKWTQVFRFGGKCLYLQSCLALPVWVFSRCLFAILRIWKSSPVPSSLLLQRQHSFSMTGRGLVMALRYFRVNSVTQWTEI